jgi:NAD(P)H-dependent FMN reductase
VSDLRIGIILGSTRPGRKGEQVARWVVEQAHKRGDAQYDLIDLAEFPLPHLDEAIPPSAAQYANDHTKAWSKTIAQYDGFVIVTPEYNRSPSGVLKNALDYLYQEWNNKAVGFVSYGAQASGLRAVEHLRQIAGELQLADVRTAVGVSLVTDFENYTTMKPIPHHEPVLATMLDQLTAWAGALRAVRQSAAAKAA